MHLESKNTFLKAAFPSAQVVELWGKSPIFPGPAWRLSWVLDNHQQEQIALSILSGVLWHSIRLQFPALGRIENPWSFSDAGRYKSRQADSRFILQSIVYFAQSLLAPARVECCQKKINLKINPPCLILRSVQHALAGSAIALCADLVKSAYLQTQYADNAKSSNILKKSIDDLIGHVNICCNHGLTMALLEDAQCRKIPAFLIDATQRLYQLGSGAYGHWISSSANDRDSAFGAAIAADKSRSRRFFSQLGLPVPLEATIPVDINADQLIKVVHKIGYPCVIKPVDAEQGRGATANIQNQEELMRAIDIAKAHTRKAILLQEHINGDDYRLNMIGGKLAFVVKRSIPHVIGNGVDSILKLITDENLRRDILRIKDGISTRVDPFDTEVQSCISRAGFAADLILPNNHKLLLRKNANISTGGLREEIDASLVHPRIRKQCEAIALTCRLDICGIDYITTDIQAEPEGNHGAYIEINSMPQNSPARASLLIANICSKNSRHSVPRVVLMADWAGPELAHDALVALENILIVHPISTIAFPGSLATRLKPLLAKYSAQYLHQYSHPVEPLLDRSVTGVVYLVTPELVLQRGLPVEYPDELVVNCAPERLQPKQAWTEFMTDCKNQ